MWLRAGKDKSISSPHILGKETPPPITKTRVIHAIYKTECISLLWMFDQGPLILPEEKKNLNPRSVKLTFTRVLILSRYSLRLENRDY